MKIEIPGLTQVIIVAKKINLYCKSDVDKLMEIGKKLNKNIRVERSSLDGIRLDGIWYDEDEAKRIIPFPTSRWRLFRCPDNVSVDPNPISHFCFVQGIRLDFEDPDENYENLKTVCHLHGFNINITMRTYDEFKKGFVMVKHGVIVESHLLEVFNEFGFVEIVEREFDLNKFFDGAGRSYEN